jgi:hypothetical protein
MFNGIKIFYFWLFVYFLLKTAFNSEDCGSPAIYKFTYFTVVNNNSSNSSQQYSSGSVIEYKCNESDYEMIYRDKRFRTCKDGKWSENIPRCGEPYNLSF